MTVDEEDATLARMEAIEEDVTKKDVAVTEKLRRVRVNVSLANESDRAAAESAGASEASAVRAESAADAAEAARDVVLIVVDGVTWVVSGWTPEDVYAAGTSLVHRGASYRALSTNQNVEPGTDNQETWMVILDVPPEVYQAAEDAEAAAIEATLQKQAAVDAKTVSVQKATEAQEAEAIATAAALAAAGYATAANEAAAGVATFADDLEELEENTTALVGQVLAGDDVGFYKRTDSNDPSSDWLRTTTWTVPGLGLAVDPLVGLEGPSLGWLGGGDVLFDSVALDGDGGGLYATNADGRLRTTDASGQWSAETAGRLGPSLGFLGDDDHVSAEAMLDEAGRLVYVPGVEGAPRRPARDGTLRDDLSESGPSQGYLVDTDTSPASYVATDVLGRLLAHLGSDGVARWPDATGRWRAGVAIEEGPSTGFFGTADDAPAQPNLPMDHAGRVLPFLGSDGRSQWQAPDGSLKTGAGFEDGPSFGYPAAADDLPARSAHLDEDGHGLPHVGDDGVSRWTDAEGVWHRGPEDIAGPSGGWVGPEEDSLATRSALDEDGVLLEAAVAGSPWVAARYVAAASGMVRVETPTDGPQVTVVGPTLELPATRVPLAAGWLHVPAVTVVSPDVTPASVTVASASLTIAEHSIWLAYQFVASVVVTRISDSVVLTPGVHYNVDLSRGVIQGLIAATVSIAYIGYPVRSDIVSVHPGTGVVTLTQGTAITRCASMHNPAVPSGNIALYRIFRSVFGGELVPLWLYRHIVRIDRAVSIEAEIAEQRRRARRHRAVVEAKVRAGEPLRLVGYGDSITAMGSGTPLEVNELPNGPRQRIDYFTLYTSTTRDLIPKENLSDGYGATYVREGWCWRLLKFLEATYGVEVGPEYYINFGIGGTDSQATVNSNGFYNQSHPDRMAAVLAYDPLPDLLVYVPGMNELGETFTYANVRTICETFEAGGLPVILGSSARPNQRFRDRIDVWKNVTTRQIGQVADDLGLPFANSLRIYDDTTLAAMKIGEREVCDTTMLNHPGKPELDAIGDLLAELF